MPYDFQQALLLGSIALNGLLGLSNVYLRYRRQGLDHELIGLKTRLRDYGARRPLKITRTIEAVMIGPRAAGKTSIAELWSKPWSATKDVDPSHTWHTYEFNFHEIHDGIAHDPLFDVARDRYRILRLRLKVYPGEAAYRTRAIRELKPAPEARRPDRLVLVFLFRVEYDDGALGGSAENAQYYSQAFVEELQKELGRVTDRVERVFVVFSKADRLPRDWRRDHALERIRMANAEALHNVERVFGGLTDYHLVSAETNERLIELLGHIGMVGAESLQEKQKLDAGLQKIRDVLRRPGG